VEAPEESRGDLHLHHDTKGLTGFPDVARSILHKIQAATVFVGDVTPVGKTPDIAGNEGVKPGRPLINSNVAIEHGFAVVLGVLNQAYGKPEDLPFDITHKRWPTRKPTVSAKREYSGMGLETFGNWRPPGGESGIRTHGTVSRTHAFQACALSHSAISPDALS
jgi:hypothetical protein